MIAKRWKRIAAWMVAMLLCISMTGSVFAEGEELASETPDNTAESVVEDTEATRTHVVRSKVTELGKVPDATKMEDRCEVLLVTDIATGVPVREKNVQVPMPISGAIVQLMTALVVLDYLAPTDTLTFTEKQLSEVPDGTVELGLKPRNEVFVSDLLVSMLFTGAVDSAKVLVDAVTEKAGGVAIGELMQQKAEQFGMSSTDYSACDGVASETLISTTAMDQCELYLQALDHPILSGLLKNGIYETASRNLEAPPETDQEKDEPATDRNNRNIPEMIQNRVKAVVPEQKVYDVRLSSAVSWPVKASRKIRTEDGYEKSDAYSVVFFRASTDRSDLAILYWLPGSGNTVQANHLVYLTDTFSRSKVVDLIPYVEVATTGLNVEKSGVSIGGWSLTGGHSMYGRVLSAYDPEAYDKVNQEAMKDEYVLADLKVLLKPDIGTLITNDDGSRTMKAKVLVDNSVEGTVTLATAPKAVKTEVSQNTNTVYTDDDVMPEEPTLMSQYGWIIIIGGVLLLGLIVIILGVVIRNRMER